MVSDVAMHISCKIYASIKFSDAYLLLTDLSQTGESNVLLNCVNLVGRLLSIPCPLSEEFQPLVVEFLKRFGDKAVDVRLAMVEHGKECLLSNPFRPDTPYIIGGRIRYNLSLNLLLLWHYPICMIMNFSLLIKNIGNISAALGEGLVDYEEAVRKNVVAALCDVAKCHLRAIPSDTIRQVADCFHDKMVLAKHLY